MKYYHKKRFRNPHPFVGKSKAEIRQIFLRWERWKKFQKMRPFFTERDYKLFFGLCRNRHKDSDARIRNEYFYLQEFYVFFKLINTNISNEEKLECLRNHSGNPIVKLFVKSCYDCFTFLCMPKRTVKARLRTIRANFFSENFTDLYDNICNSMSIYDAYCYINTYFYFYRRKNRKDILNISKNDGFICGNKNKQKINEIFGEKVISDFVIRKHVELNSKTLIKDLGNVKDYYIVKHPIGVEAYLIFDHIGKPHLFGKSHNKNEYVILKKIYMHYLDELQLGFKDIVFEVIVSTLDNDNKTKKITSQYLNNLRRIKLFSLDNVHFGVYDVYSFDEYKEGYAKESYAKRQENLHKLLDGIMFENTQILEATKIRSKKHLVSFVEFCQEKDGEDFWDGLAFIKNNEFNKTDTIPFVQIRQNYKLPDSYRKRSEEFRHTEK